MVSVAIRNTKKRAPFSLCLTTECFYWQVQDAQVAMKLYTLHRNQWERQLKELKFKHLKNGKSQEKNWLQGRSDNGVYEKIVNLDYNR